MELAIDGFDAVLRRLRAEDEPALRRIRETPEVWRWWDDVEPDWPLGDDPSSVRLTIVAGGEVAGLIQFWEENDPKYRHASVDVFLDPALHGRGLGTAALSLLARHLIDDRGHHRITIDPAVENAAAIRSYEKAGFRRVGVMREYERDSGGSGWHDSLLMELLASDVPRSA
jgi:aminoglycoside 6'-N-acetyltransferase